MSVSMVLWNVGYNRKFVFKVCNLTYEAFVPQNTSEGLYPIKDWETVMGIRNWTSFHSDSLTTTKQQIYIYIKLI